MIFRIENLPICACKEVLSKKSEYFEAIFRSKMKESIEGVVELPESVSRAAFLTMLEYMCLDDFVWEDMDYTVRREMNELADMYFLEGLKLCCNSCKYIGGTRKRRRIGALLPQSR